MAEVPRVIGLKTAVLLGIILFLGQLLITQWTIRAAGQREIIDYVSFAGTVTSMLLAVLAIVYSYYTTTSQKNDADRIAAQIAALSGTVVTLDQSEARLANELIRLSEIRGQLDDVNDRVKSSNELSVATRESVESMRADLAARTFAAEEKAANRGDGENEGLEFLASLIAESTDKQCIMFFAAYRNIMEEVKIMSSVERDVLPYMREHSGITANMYFGEVFAYLMVFLQMSVLRDGGPSEKVFVNKMIQRVERLPAIDDEKVLWSKAKPSLLSELRSISV